ncbi:hypothetical protein K488DRAFT_47278 [Vararia minispora EC-137]|uniref:Uncharacterized protein n=1 Tax=Vararia minispora EC-137 TaxID=1314806 RepID=A0ACB8QPW3_9AGAM|nr:hypothetical protein K488DRAFT_47278 [Vararia minispora EC-137]
MSNESSASAWILVPLIASVGFGFYGYFRRYARSRQRLIPPHKERVVILGASRGIGLSIAHRYVERGARICIVGRDVVELETARLECVGLLGEDIGEDWIASYVADFTKEKDLVSLRHTISDRWEGFDTLVVCAGVSATRPLLDIAGTEEAEGPNFAGVKKVGDIASLAMKVNYLGPLLSAVTMIPFMERTSRSPSILLVSSLGAAIPAPTRSIYGSTKAASLALYQALAIEHPKITFTYILPSTVQGSFRASAVDAEPQEMNTAPAEQTASTLRPRSHGLTREAVAKRCVAAIDAHERVVFYPPFYVYAQLLYWFWPSFIERQAAKKYGFTAQ